MVTKASSRSVPSEITRELKESESVSLRANEYSESPGSSRTARSVTDGISEDRSATTSDRRPSGLFSVLVSSVSLASTVARFEASESSRRGARRSVARLEGLRIDL